MASFPLAWFFMSGNSPGLPVLFMSEVGGISIMLRYPQPDEDARSAFFSSLLLFAVMAVCHFVGAGVGVDVVSALLLDSLHFAALFRVRYSRTRTLLRQQIVRYALESQERMVYALFLGVFASAGLLFSSQVWVMLAVCVLLAVLYVLLLCVSRSGRIILLGREKERSVRQAVLGVRETRSIIPHDESAMMRDLFAKVVSIMESARPFLDEEYSLQDLSMAVYTNKTYLSKTINVMSGKNFRQFINGYRIMYSIEILKKNPRLRVDELASMSGFHSTVTYTMAFKANMNETPGEYSQRLRSHLV